MLFWHKHNIEKSLADLPNFTPFPDEWTVEDKVLFEQAFSFHGKTFHRIQQMVSEVTGMEKQNRRPDRCLQCCLYWPPVRTEQAKGDVKGKALPWIETDNLVSRVSVEVFFWSAFLAQDKLWLCSVFWWEITVFSLLHAMVVFVSAGVQAWSVHMCPPTHKDHLCAKLISFLTACFLGIHLIWQWSLYLMWFGTVSGYCDRGLLEAFSALLLFSRDFF